MASITKREITGIANAILENNPSPVVKYRLLRDVLKLPCSSHELSAAYDDLQTSQFIQTLAQQQRPDGSWGRFHSRNSKERHTILTTEIGVERALSLGLDHRHEILQRASDHICKVLNKTIPFPDPPEKNERWEIGTRLFAASTLSLITPAHPNLDRDRALWKEIANWTFQSGEYCEEDEIKAHLDLTGVSMQNTYLIISGKYPLNILGSTPKLLSSKTEEALLKWLWKRPTGIGYLTVSLDRPPQTQNRVDPWLASYELLARGFPGWVNIAQDSMRWLWDQRNSEGLWDFGSKPLSLANLPLSDTWQKKNDRIADWTTRVLCLMQKFTDEIK
jgi:hypothetical protein